MQCRRGQLREASGVGPCGNTRSAAQVPIRPSPISGRPYGDAGCGGKDCLTDRKIMEAGLRRRPSSQPMAVAGPRDGAGAATCSRTPRGARRTRRRPRFFVGVTQQVQQHHVLQRSAGRSSVARSSSTVTGSGERLCSRTMLAPPRAPVGQHGLSRLLRTRSAPSPAPGTRGSAGSAAGMKFSSESGSRRWSATLTCSGRSPPSAIGRTSCRAGAWRSRRSGRRVHCIGVRTASRPSARGSRPSRSPRRRTAPACRAARTAGVHHPDPARVAAEHRRQPPAQPAAVELHVLARARRRRRPPRARSSVSLSSVSSSWLRTKVAHWRRRAARAARAEPRQRAGVAAGQREVDRPAWR